VEIRGWLRAFSLAMGSESLDMKIALSALDLPFSWFLRTQNITPKIA
jgi:hypothetical protein